MMNIKHPNNRVREIRESLGLSQEAFAAVLIGSKGKRGIGRSGMSKKENGESPLTLDDMVRLSEVAGCEPYEFIKSRAQIIGEGILMASSTSKKNRIA